MWKPRSSLRAVVAGLVAVGASVVLVPQAAANSFTETLGDATGETITVTYNDGDDQFCVNYAPSRVRGESGATTRLSCGQTIRTADRHIHSTLFKVKALSAFRWLGHMKIRTTPTSSSAIGGTTAEHPSIRSSI